MNEEWLPPKRVNIRLTAGKRREVKTLDARLWSVAYQHLVTWYREHVKACGYVCLGLAAFPALALILASVALGAWSLFAVLLAGGLALAATGAMMVARPERGIHAFQAEWPRPSSGARIVRHMQDVAHELRPAIAIGILLLVGWFAWAACATAEATWTRLSIDSVASQLKQAGPAARVAAVGKLAGLAGVARPLDSLTSALVGALADPDPAVRTAAARAIGSYSDERSLRPLADALADPDSKVRGEATAALADRIERLELGTALNERLCAELRKGSDAIRQRDGWGQTYLHMASARNEGRLARLLISLGSDVSARDRFGFAPLDEAVRAGSDELARLLIKNGADVNAVTNRGLTALHWAAIRGSPPVTETLLAAGADVTVKDEWGRTAAELWRLCQPGAVPGGLEPGHLVGAAPAGARREGAFANRRRVAITVRQSYFKRKDSIEWEPFSYHLPFRELFESLLGSAGVTVADNSDLVIQIEARGEASGAYRTRRRRRRQWREWRYTGARLAGTISLADRGQTVRTFSFEHEQRGDGYGPVHLIPVIGYHWPSEASHAPFLDTFRTMGTFGGTACHVIREMYGVYPFVGALRRNDASISKGLVEIGVGPLARAELIKAGKSAVWPIVPAVLDDRPEIRDRAVSLLGEIGDRDPIETLIVALKLDSPAAAITLASWKGAEQVLPLVGAVTASQHADARETAARALGAVRDPAAVDALIVALGDSSKVVRSAAAVALGELKDPRALRPLVEAVVDEERKDLFGGFRKKSIEALREIDGDQAVEQLIVQMERGDQQIKRAASDALRSITGWKIKNAEDPQAWRTRWAQRRPAGR